MSLWRPDVTQRLHRQMLIVRSSATPSTSPNHKAASGLPIPQTPISRALPGMISGSNGIIPATPSSINHRPGAVGIGQIPTTPLRTPSIRA
jgi:hypothetical protein